MNSAKVYKIDVRSNVLRQVIFTNTNIFIGLAIISTALSWKLAESLAIELRVFLALFISGTLMLVFTTKTDRQTLFQIGRRLPAYFSRNRKQRC